MTLMKLRYPLPIVVMPQPQQPGAPQKRRVGIVEGGLPSPRVRLSESVISKTVSVSRVA